MVLIRRWSCRIVGLYSGRSIALDFCRFFTRQGAEAHAERMNRIGAYNEGELLLTRVEAYRRPWRP